MEPEESMTAQPCARGPAQRWRVALAALWLVWGAAAQAQTALATTTYGYDEAANKTSQVDALGRKTEWTFDARDRVAARTLPDGTQETYRYDALANALSRTTFAGETFQFQYDANNNLTRQVIPAGTGTNSAIGAASVVTTYTATGNVATRQEQGATTLEGLQSFRYDANDRLIEARSPIGHISYSLDPMGNVLERSIPGAGTVRYELDAAGRLARVLAADGKATVYSYDAAGRLIAVERELNPLGGQPQSLVRSIGYDAADQPVTLSEVKRVGASLTFVVGQTITRGPGGVVSKIETHRGHGTSSTDGQLTAKVEAIQSFEYDALARLTRELRSYAGASTDTRYEYDAVGNRSRKIVIKAIGTEITTYTYDIADRLVHESTSLMTGGSRVVSYTWDSNGNLASKAEPGQVTLYRFDPRNRLIDIRVGATQAEAQEASPKVRYAYDAEGNRVRKWTGEERGYLVDANTVFAQVALEATPASSIEYVRGLELIRQTSRTGTTIEDLFPLHGHLGTSLGALNADGDLIEQVDSDAFGNMDQRAGLKQTHLYAGEYWDQDSQLLYLGARWYDPRIGRFASADPFEGRQRDPRSLNRYAYAHSDPVHSVDPTGRFSLIASPVFSAMVNVGIRLGGAGIATGVMVRVAAQLVRMGVRTSTLVKVLADNCATDAALTDRNCRGELPTFFLGDDYREHTQFVSWAQAGASPKTLTRSTRNPVGWYRGTPECDGLTGRASGLDCDEYPYVSTTQGGPRNYPGQVVLEPVPIPDNRGAGAKLGAFYRNGDCPIPPDSGDRSNFLVVPVLGAPSTYWTCGK